MRILLLLAIALSALSLDAQLIAEYDFRAATSPPAGLGDYGMNGFFLDTDGRGVTTSNVKPDTTHYFDAAGRKFIVRSKSGASPFQIGLDPIGHAFAPQGGIGQLTDLTEEGMPYFSGGVNDKIRAAINAEQMRVIDPLLGTGGGGGPPNYQTYNNDTEAAAAGVAIGEQYLAGVRNTRGAPFLTPITRIQ